MRTPLHTLYVVRHGENPANLNREFSYRLIDYSLTEKGVRQAEETAAFFRDRAIAAIYSSPLKRAREMAQIIAAPLALPVTIVEEFRENNVGDLEREPPTEAAWALHDSIIAEWVAGRHDAIFPGGEDFHTLLRRVRAGLRSVLADLGEGPGARRAIIVAHGGILEGMARGLAHEPDLAAIEARACVNCSVSEFAARLIDGETGGETGGIVGGELELHLREWSACDHLS